MSTQPFKIEDPIADLRRTYNAAAQRGDADQMAAMAADHIVCMPPNDTTLYVFYGNSAVTSSSENKTGVWDSPTFAVRQI